MTTLANTARTLGFSALAATALLATAPSDAHASNHWQAQTHGMTLYDTHAISSVNEYGETVTTTTEIYKNAKGRTYTVTRTEKGSTGYKDDYHQPKQWSPEPQVYPEYDPNWAPAPQVYPEYNPDWTPAPQAYPEYNPDYKKPGGSGYKY